MGQYYKVVILSESTYLKLMEHSYQNVPFMLAIPEWYIELVCQFGE